MTNESGDDLFTSKVLKVRNVLETGEGFAELEVDYEQRSGLVLFRAAGALPFKMRRDEFDAKSDCEIAFFAATRMRRVVAVARPVAKRLP